MRQGATEHDAARAAASALAEALRSIRLDPAALGSVAAVTGFASAVTAAAGAQAAGAAVESDHRAQARASGASAAAQGDAMIGSTTRVAQSATPR